MDNIHTEGGLEAPTRHPIPWQDESFYDEAKLNAELVRVFDVCHGCRRCVNLCEAFPTLFDLIDQSKNFDVDSVDESDYPKVSEQCYLCGMCYQSKCPYVPPHKWAIDFPHLMLRAKAVAYQKKSVRIRDRIITSTDSMGRLINAGRLNRLMSLVMGWRPFRVLLDMLFGIHRDARLPGYPRAGRSNTKKGPIQGRNNGRKVAVFRTCHGKWNDPGIAQDLVAVLQHNGVHARMLEAEWCCAMPKLDLGDLKAVERHKELNLPVMTKAVAEGYDIIATVPSCVFMFKEELPLMFPEDPEVQRLARHVFDPFEYLHALHRAKSFNTTFTKSLGKIAHQSACHQRVQNIGNKTREVLSLVPDTEINTIERCSGHNGTYAVKSESYDYSMKIAAPVAKAVRELKAQSYTSDCPLSGQHIAHALDEHITPPHPISLLRYAYGI